MKHKVWLAYTLTPLDITDTPAWKLPQWLPLSSSRGFEVLGEVRTWIVFFGKVWIPLSASVAWRDIGGRLNPASSSRCFSAWLIRDHN